LSPRAKRTLCGRGRRPSSLLHWNVNLPATRLGSWRFVLGCRKSCPGKRNTRRDAGTRRQKTGFEGDGEDRRGCRFPHFVWVDPGIRPTRAPQTRPEAIPGLRGRTPDGLEERGRRMYGSLDDTLHRATAIAPLCRGIRSVWFPPCDGHREFSCICRRT
jgi:hypothetical protein